MDVLTFLANIGSALVMGTAIGLERQIRLHTAGLRVNALVCVGAALFVSLSVMMGDASATRWRPRSSAASAFWAAVSSCAKD